MLWSSWLIFVSYGGFNERSSGCGHPLRVWSKYDRIAATTSGFWSVTFFRSPGSAARSKSSCTGADLRGNRERRNQRPPALDECYNRPSSHRRQATSGPASPGPYPRQAMPAGD